MACLRRNTKIIIATCLYVELLDLGLLWRVLHVIFYACFTRILSRWFNLIFNLFSIDHLNKKTIFIRIYLIKCIPYIIRSNCCRIPINAYLDLALSCVGMHELFSSHSVIPRTQAFFKTICFSLPADSVFVLFRRSACRCITEFYSAVFNEIYHAKYELYILRIKAQHIFLQ